MGFDLTALSKWTNENKNELKSEIILSANTAQHISVKNDIKYKEQIKYLSSAMSLTNANCSTPMNSTTSFDKKDIEVFMLNYSESICPADLEQYSFQLLMKAGSDINGEIPGALGQAFAKHKIDTYAAKVENLIWNGTAGVHVTPGVTADYAIGQFEGFLTKWASDADVDKTTVFDFRTSSGSASDYLAALHAIYNLLPAEAQSQSNIKIFMGIPEFNIYNQKLMLLGNSIIQDNLNKFGGNTIPLLGTNATVVGVAGLSGTGRVAATLADNLVLGSDVATEAATIKFKESENDYLIASIKAKFGVQYFFPQYIVSNATS